MTTRAEADNPDIGRHPYGPRPLAALLPPIVRPALKKRAPATAALIADWEAIVGPELSRATTPRKLFAGTLTIGCAGPMALELQHLSGALMERINRHLGQLAVTRLRFHQEAARRIASPKPPKVRDQKAARARVADIDDPALREALEQLGSHLDFSKDTRTA